MKKLSRLIIVLCTCATFFCQVDTDSPKVWGRNVQPRLSTTLAHQPCRNTPPDKDRIVQDTQCGSGELIPSFSVCDKISYTSTLKHVLDVLAFEPTCTDDAILALERLKLADARAHSDLAAAYYVRAQRLDAPSDLLRALTAAEEAIEATPNSRNARFNRALILDALDLPQALQAWDAFLAVADAPWDEEARQAGRRRAARVDDAALWKRNRAALPAALAASDRKAVANLIARFPSPAQSYFEDELLSQLAAAPTPEQFQRVSLFAAELRTRLKGDPFATDVVAAMKRSTDLTALRKGHLTYLKGRRHEQLLEFDTAQALYAEAIAWLNRAGSPFAVRARLGHAIAVSFPPDGRSRALPLLVKLEHDADRLHYENLAARIRRMRANSLDHNGYLESLTAYDETLEYYERTGDRDARAAVYSRRAGVHKIAGHKENAWRDALTAVRNASSVVEAKDRDVVFLEAAAAASLLGHPQAALLYYDADVAAVRAEIAATPPEDTHQLNRLTQQLGMAFGRRATVHEELARVFAREPGRLLDHKKKAAQDRAESARLERVIDNPDPNTRRIQAARAFESTGDAILTTNPRRAVEAFSRAFDLTPEGFRTDRATRRRKRAEARLRLGQTDEAERDLREAIAILRSEEQDLLIRRTPGQRDWLWSPYFGRFAPTYHMLIELLTTEKKHALAFMYAELARAAEPLDLLRMRGIGPGALPPPEDETAARAAIAKIQADLEPGTFLIQYSVAKEVAFAWVISNDLFAPVPLKNVTAKTVNDWSGALQRAVRREDVTSLDAVLVAAHDRLLAPVLEKIGPVTPSRFVFIPDSGIHGLPLAALRDYTTRQFMIELAPIEIAGSTQLYRLSLERDHQFKPVQHPSILVIGNPYFDRGHPLARRMPRLPHAEDEANRIGELYDIATVLLNDEGTEAALLRHAPDSHVVHIAAHGIVGQEPEGSVLLLAPSKPDDGIVDTQTLLKGFKVGRTRLVILSACSTAGGLPIGPEGLAPLVRPLLAAGVPAVIGSLWDVNDATTEDLMVSFHRHYVKGSEAAVAMRAAQLELLKKPSKDSGLRSVLAWAPFQVIGHASSPFGPHAPHGGTSIGIHSSHSLQRSDGLRPQ